MKSLTVDQFVQSITKITECLNHLAACVLLLNMSYGSTTGLDDFKVESMLEVCVAFVDCAIKAVEEFEQINQDKAINLTYYWGLLKGMMFILEGLKSLDLSREYTAMCLDGIFCLTERLRDEFAAWEGV